MANHNDHGIAEEPACARALISARNFLFKLLDTQSLSKDDARAVRDLAMQIKSSPKRRIEQEICIEVAAADKHELADSASGDGKFVCLESQCGSLNFEIGGWFKSETYNTKMFVVAHGGYSPEGTIAHLIAWEALTETILVARPLTVHVTS